MDRHEGHDGDSARTTANATPDIVARPTNIDSRSGKGSRSAADYAGVTPPQGRPGAQPRPLHAPVRRQLQNFLGVDLNAVRVHTGQAAQEATAGVDARAYAKGNDIYFAEGEYTPGTRGGDHLIAHEVAHTVQQSGGARTGAQCKLNVSQPGDRLEQEADAVADQFVNGLSPSWLSPASTQISRSPSSRRRSAPARPQPSPAGDQYSQQVASMDQSECVGLLRRAFAGEGEFHENGVLHYRLEGIREAGERLIDSRARPLTTDEQWQAILGDTILAVSNSLLTTILRSVVSAATVPRDATPSGPALPASPASPASPAQLPPGVMPGGSPASLPPGVMPGASPATLPAGVAPAAPSGAAPASRPLPSASSVATAIRGSLTGIVAAFTSNSGGTSNDIHGFITRRRLATRTGWLAQLGTLTGDIGSVEDARANAAAMLRLHAQAATVAGRETNAVIDEWTRALDAAAQGGAGRPTQGQRDTVLYGDIGRITLEEATLRPGGTGGLQKDVPHGRPTDDSGQPLVVWSHPSHASMRGLEERVAQQFLSRPLNDIDTDWQITVRIGRTDWIHLGRNGELVGDVSDRAKRLLYSYSTRSHRLVSADSAFIGPNWREGGRKLWEHALHNGDISMAAMGIASIVTY